MTGPAIPFREAARAWTRVALASFGGPAGQIAVIHRIIVEEKRWVREERFAHALNYCMLLPGPEAQQLATYLGWLLHGTRGGLLAGSLFVLPGFLSILGLSLVYVCFGKVELVTGILFGLKPAILAIVVAALVHLGGRVLSGRLAHAIAAAAFLALFVFRVPFPLVVVAAAIAGALALPPGAKAAAPSPEPDRTLVRGHAAAPLRTLAVWLALWLLPVALLHLLPGVPRVFMTEAAFFSKMAVVTFGGAYAVLAYVAQQAVEIHRWLSPAEMLDGLGLAETTPGPLIMVVQFVGFLGAYRAPGTLDPILAGVLGSVLTTWVTFVPSFLFVLVGAPYVEALRQSRALAGALRGISAAVVGVILNLALWFALHALFRDVGRVEAGPAALWVPVWSSVQAGAVAIAVAALVGVFRFRLSLFATLGGAAAAGAVLHAAGGS
jgi:chromate transporter